MRSVLLGAMLLLALAAFPVPSARAETCPNEAIRAEQGEAALALPDCRAYEMVSPVGAAPYVSEQQTAGSLASPSGEAMSYFSFYPFPQAERQGMSFLSTRGPGGWSTESLVPPQSPAAGASLPCNPAVYLSPDLARSILVAGFNYEGLEGGHCQHFEPSLVPGEPEGFQNLLLGEAGSHQLLNITPAGVQPANAYLEAASVDFGRAFFEERAKLTPEAPELGSGGRSGAEGGDLYQWDAGALHLVTFLPNGTPVQGHLVEGTAYNEDSLATVRNTVSADGERALFYAQGNLYLRQNVARPPAAGGNCTPVEPTAACTVQVDAAAPGVVGPGGGGEFLWASADDSRVFFTDGQKLTTDSTAVLAKPDLYEYDLESGELADLTVDPAEHADVLGLAGAGQDGSYLYFIATGVLSGAQRNSQGARARVGSPNLYLSHAGSITYVAEAGITTVREEATDVAGAGASPDGAFLAFLSNAQLTGYENHGVTEAYEYSAQSGQLTCASCDPDGAPPLGPAYLTFKHRSSESLAPYHPARALLDDGALFFNSPDPLSARDTNDRYDVYEYDAGQAHLISSGTAGESSYFSEADPGGADVFFITDQALVRRDTDNGPSLYDARVGGGFPEPPPPPACEAESCRGPDSSPPPAASPATAIFHGSGNETPKSCKKGKVPRAGKCVKKPSKQAHKHRRRTSGHRRDNANRGGDR